MSKLVIVALVVLVACASGATAASLITGQDVKNGSLTSKDVRDGSLRAGDLKDGFPVGGAGATGPPGSAGPGGATGPTGPAGPVQLVYVRGGEEGASSAALIGPDQKGGVEVSCPHGTYPLTGTLEVDGEGPVVTRFSGPVTAAGVPTGWRIALANEGEDPAYASVLVVCASATTAPSVPAELPPAEDP
jgi:hypothetical protein